MINGNLIKDEGVVFLSDGIIKLKKLKKLILNLSDNDISDKGASYLL